MRTARSIFRDLLWAELWAMAYATAYALLASLILLFKSDASRDALGMSLGAIVGWYYVTGAVAAVPLGLLRPWLKTRFGYAMVGAVIASSVYITLLIALNDLSTETAIIAMIVGTGVGGTVGYRSWNN